jgi:hypothetical protein
MAATSQTYSTHRRWLPAYHFFVIPVLTVNAVVVIMQTVKYPSGSGVLAALVAIALLIGMLAARTMPLRAQDRVIRMEERTRIAQLAPGDQKAVYALTESQLVGLRFAPDDEVPELVRRIQSGELKSQSDIKRAIKNWRADHFRV